jgi:hypothetical protein
MGISGGGGFISALKQEQTVFRRLFRPFVRFIVTPPLFDDQ